MCAGLSSPQSQRTRSRAQDKSPRSLVSLCPLMCTVRPLGAGSQGRAGVASPALWRRIAQPAGVMLPPLSLCYCITFSDTGWWADPKGSAVCGCLVSPALAEAEDLQRSPQIGLILAFSPLVSPSSSLPRRKRPLPAELPAVQLQREPARPERGGSAHIPPDLRSLRLVGPLAALPQDRLPDPVPGGGGS